ncbi:MAG: hypothetical protein LAO51_15045 [Acidobacteriia bacterium]|nr:hypothetical protein [Terriglobia bacterium]
MMLARIRHDDAWRSLPYWGLILGLNAGVFTGLVTALALKRHVQVPPILVVLVGGFTFALYLVLGGGKARCRVFDLALPISARRIWLAHLAAVALAGTLLVAWCVGIAALPTGTVGGIDVRCPGLPGLGLLLESGMLLAAVLLQLPKPSLARIPDSRAHDAWNLLVLLGVIALLAALSGAGPAGALVPLALAAAAFVRGFRSVPEAFVVVPRDPADGRSRSAEGPTATDPGEAVGPPGRVPWSVRLAAFRCLTSGVKEWIVYSLIVLLGLFLGGALTPWRDDGDLRDLRYVYIPLASYMLFSFVMPRLALLQDLDPLPLSRRALFAGLVLPGAIAFAAAWSAGALVESRFGVRAEFVDFLKDEQTGRWSVTVPLRIHRLAFDGRAPEILSPWGESHPADRQPLLRGGRGVIWSPYSTPPGCSARFVALQISRASEAIYGLPLPIEEVERSWLATLPDGSIVGRAPGLPIRAERPGLSPRSGPAFPVLMTLVVVPWLLLVAALFRAYRSTIPDKARRAIHWGGMGLLILPLPVQLVTTMAHLARPWLVRAFVEIPTWELGRSALGTVAAWVGGGLLLIVAYRVAEIQFLRMEIPANPVPCSLIVRAREES